MNWQKGEKWRKFCERFKKISMKPRTTFFLLILVMLGSCLGESHYNETAEIDAFGEFDLISKNIRDSLVLLNNSEQIPMFLSTRTASEPELNQTFQWILDNGTPQDFIELLYQHPNPELKAVGVKGLIHKKDQAIFQHLKFAINQDLNIQYGLYCQKLGGYFLYQLNYSNSDSVHLYFSKDEIQWINEILETKMFGCT